MVLLLPACQGSPPKISGLEWSLILVRDKSGDFSEYLSLFLKADDKDGSKDMEDMYLSSIQTRLFWHSRTGEWDTRSVNGEKWIGRTDYSSPEGVPRGEYRVRLIDRGGESAEESFYINLPVFDKTLYTPASREIPVLEVNGATAHIKGSGGPYQCVGWSGDGTVQAVFETSEETVSLVKYIERAGDVSLVWYIFRFDSTKGWYIGSGPY